MSRKSRRFGVWLTALIVYASFGVVFVGIAGLSYVNVPGADSVFTFPVHVGTSLLLALAAAALATHRRAPGRRAID